MNSENLGMSDLSIGVNKNGMENYIHMLLDSLFVQTKKNIQDVSDVITAINSGWQGVSRDNFINDLNGTISEMVSNLDLQKNNLETQLTTLMYNYLNLDADLYGNDYSGNMGDVAGDL